MYLHLGDSHIKQPGTIQVLQCQELMSHVGKKFRNYCFSAFTTFIFLSLSTNFSQWVAAYSNQTNIMVRSIGTKRTS